MRHQSYWLALAGALLLAPSLAQAQSRVDQLGAAAAISATDTVPVCQTCGSSTPLLAATYTQIMTFIKAQVNTWGGAQTFGEAHGTTYAPTLTSNNFTATTTDCGKTLLFPTGTTPTLTLPNLNAACTIVVVQNSAVQFTPQAASGGTLNANVNGFTKSKAQNAFLMFTITVPSASAATWAWSGDGA